jgi:hypothetical protein
MEIYKIIVFLLVLFIVLAEKKYLAKEETVSLLLV